MNTAASSLRLSIVIPVYRGAMTLPTVLQEIAPLTHNQKTQGGIDFHISEVLLVHDCGPDHSEKVILDLTRKYAFLKPVWLSKNFGQHPATLAGMASVTGDYVVTMDEDGQQNPADIGAMLDTALLKAAQLVYARPTNLPPHSLLRNTLSTWAKRIATVLVGNSNIMHFNSFRLVDGEIARSLAAYCGSGVFLDIALLWITDRTAQCPVLLRKELDRPSGYSFLKLFRHFWQLMLTSGTRPLRVITIVGFCSLILATAITIYALWMKFHLEVPVQGWASLVIVMSFFSGCILMALGIIAEYLAVTMSIVMGKPLYIVTTKPTRRPPNA